MGPPLRPFSFSSPKRKEILEASSFDDAKSTLERTIRSHHFCHAIDVFLPKCNQVPSNLNDSVFAAQECEYYLVKDLSLAKLLDWDFIGAFVRTGRMSVLSHGTRIDVDNCVCLQHPGQLVLSLNKDSYEELGLQGKPSHPNGNKRPIKYVVHIDLLAKNFYPGRKLYDKSLRILEQRTWLRFTLLFCWTPHDDSISRRSLYNYLKGWKNDVVDDIDVCAPRHEASCAELRVPKIDCLDLLGSDPRGVNCSLPDFIEWLGVVGCDVHCGNNIDPYISTYKCPNLTDETMLLTHAQWLGFFASDTLIQLVHHLRELVRGDAAIKRDWAAAVVHGYVDVPSLIDGRHRIVNHHPSAATYVVIVLPDSRYWLCTGESPSRLPKEDENELQKKCH